MSFDLAYARFAAEPSGTRYLSRDRLDFMPRYDGDEEPITIYNGLTFLLPSMRGQTISVEEAAKTDPAVRAELDALLLTPVQAATLEDISRNMHMSPGARYRGVLACLRNGITKAKMLHLAEAVAAWAAQQGHPILAWPVPTGHSQHLETPRTSDIAAWSLDLRQRGTIPDRLDGILRMLLATAERAESTCSTFNLDFERLERIILAAIATRRSAALATSPEREYQFKNHINGLWLAKSRHGTAFSRQMQCGAIIHVGGVALDGFLWNHPEADALPARRYKNGPTRYRGGRGQ